MQSSGVERANKRRFLLAAQSLLALSAWGVTGVVRSAVNPRTKLVVGPALLVVIWEAASRLGFLSPATLTAPPQALVTAWQMVADGSLLPHLLASAGRQPDQHRGRPGPAVGALWRP